MRWSAASVSAAALSLVLAVAAPARSASDPVGRWPLAPAPEVVAYFEPPSAPWGPGHRGVDLLGSPGQPVRAALPGRVSFAGPVAGLGVVSVDHGDTRTTYQPVAAAVERGDRVRAGEVLGRLALPGSHCLPRSCLHWGWLRGSTYLDPLRLVGAGAVRLLPLAGLPVAPAATDPVPLRRHPYAGWRPVGARVPPGWVWVTRVGVPADRPCAADRWSRGCRAGSWRGMRDRAAPGPT